MNVSDNYQVSVGASRNGAEASGYYTHQGSVAEIQASASYLDSQYSAVSASMQGGATLTAEGGALHRISQMGGTRMLVDTDGVAGVPVSGYGGSPAYSNVFGKVIVTDMISYNRNSIRIDVDKLADTAEATRSVTQSTLTEGAIGFRSFEVIDGGKAMAVIRLADGTFPPFGATVLNSKKQETGIVADEGNVWLSGIRGGEKMSVYWNGALQCSVTLPESFQSGIAGSLLLPCIQAR